ncbi:MAG: GAF domain-containing protein, partial [Myxococcota bacterium]
VYLVGVLVVSTVWGFGLAATTSVASAVTFDYFRNGPADFTLTRLENWSVISIFVVVALVANTLAHLARTRAVEAEHSRDELRVLADLQASLRRVATLVARGIDPSEVFSAVADELARCLGMHHATLFRFEPDGTGLLLSAHHEPAWVKVHVGERFSLEGESVAAMVFRTGHPARMDSQDHDKAPGPAAEYFRRLGMRSGVGVPIMVDGRVWGAAIVGSSQPDPLPSDTESRVADFADLVTTAIANAETHTQLTASRARIVAAGDEARRRFERDLHDGAQQRLVSLGLKLRSAEASVPPDLGSVREQLAEIVDGLTGVFHDLQEISRGIHPAILSRGGLGP